MGPYYNVWWIVHRYKCGMCEVTHDVPLGFVTEQWKVRCWNTGWGKWQHSHNSTQVVGICNSRCPHWIVLACCIISMIMYLSWERAKSPMHNAFEISLRLIVDLCRNAKKAARQQATCTRWLRSSCWCILHNRSGVMGSFWEGGLPRERLIPLITACSAQLHCGFGRPRSSWISFMMLM